MEEKEFKMLKQVLPVGTLRYVGKEYWLLSPEPVAPDWEITVSGVVPLYRFSVVPKEPVNSFTSADTGEAKYYYPHARHLIVSTGWSLEYQIIEKKIYIIDADWLLSAMGETNND